MRKPCKIYQPQLQRKFCFLFCFQKVFQRFLLSLSAQLLCESHHNRVRKENCHLLKTTHRRQRRNHLRLQIPTGRWEDSLSMWCSRMSWNIKLSSPPRPLIFHICFYFPSSTKVRLWSVLINSLCYFIVYFLKIFFMSFGFSYSRLRLFVASFKEVFWIKTSR